MKNRPSKEILTVLGVIFLLVIVSFYDVIFLGKTFKVTTSNSQAFQYGPYGQKDNKTKFIPVNGTDSSVLEEPIYEFIKRSLRKGIIPLWNPYQACGYPLIGIIQVGMFFPLNFILYIFPQLFAWDILILTRFFLAGLLTYWLMKTLGFKFAPSLAASIIFMLSGPMVLYQYWTVNVDLMLPILLIAIDQMIRKTKLTQIAFLAFTIGMTFLAGHPEHIFLVNLYGGIFFIYRFFSLRKTIDCKKVLTYTFFAYFLGLLLSSMALFPFLRNLATEFWKGHPEGLGSMHEEIRERMLTLALPHFFQKESLTFQFSFAGWWGGYIGTIPFILAFLSLFNNHKRGLNYFLAIFGFLIISKAYGFFFINWIGYLPILKMCRWTPHVLHIFALTIAILAGMGVRTILLKRNNSIRALMFSTVLLIIIGIHLFVYRDSAHFDLSIKASLFALGVLACFHIVLFLRDKKLLKKKMIVLALLFVITAELFLYIHRERPRRFDSFSKVPYIEFLKDLPERGRSYGIFWVFYPNTATAYEVDDLGIFFGLLPKRFVEFYNTLIERRFRNDLRPPALRAAPITTGKPFLDLLNLRHIITPTDDVMNRLILGYADASESRSKPIYSEEVNIYRRKDTFQSG